MNVHRIPLKPNEPYYTMRTDLFSGNVTSIKMVWSSK